MGCRHMMRLTNQDLEGIRARRDADRQEHRGRIPSGPSLSREVLVVWASIYPMHQVASFTSSTLPLAAERMPASSMAMASRLKGISSVKCSGSPVSR